MREGLKGGRLLSSSYFNEWSFVFSLFFQVLTVWKEQRVFLGFEEVSLLCKEEGVWFKDRVFLGLCLLF